MRTTPCKLLDELEANRDATLRALSEQLLISRQHLLAACLETVLKRRFATELAQKEWTCACGRSRARGGRTRGTVDAARADLLTGPTSTPGRGTGVTRWMRNSNSRCHPPVRHPGARDPAGAEIPFGLSAEQSSGSRRAGVRALYARHPQRGRQAARLEHIVPPADEIGRASRKPARITPPPVLAVACDGAHAPTRPAGGRETRPAPGRS